MKISDKELIQHLVVVNHNLRKCLESQGVSTDDDPLIPKKFEEECVEASKLKKPTTKVCPDCGCTNLLLLKTYNKKVCSECSLEFEWTLDEGQKPLR